VSTYADALKHFKNADPTLHGAAKRARGLPEKLAGKRGADALFAALASSVVSQQLSTKAAATIKERLRAACGGAITADAIAKARTDKLRKCGLSAAKVKTIKSLAAAIRSGALDLSRLARIPEDEAAAKLTQVWGIGPWTAEMFLMFALGRPDVFSPGDLGLMRSMEELYGLPKNGSKEKLIEIARAWSPHRTYACLVLWNIRDKGEDGGW
jgi:DNA-3-methyladenine glycosylase II